MTKTYDNNFAYSLDELDTVLAKYLNKEFIAATMRPQQIREAIVVAYMTNRNEPILRAAHAALSEDGYLKGIDE